MYRSSIVAQKELSFSVQIVPVQLCCEFHMCVYHSCRHCLGWMGICCAIEMNNLSYKTLFGRMVSLDEEVEF